MVKARYDRSGLMDRQGVVMNKLVLGSFAVAMTMGGSAAMAADMPLKAPPAPVVFSWTGCYVGIEGGGAWGRSKHTQSQGAFANQDFTPWFDISGGLGGFEYGCNKQFGGYLLFGNKGYITWSAKM